MNVRESCERAALQRYYENRFRSAPAGMDIAFLNKRLAALDAIERNPSDVRLAKVVGNLARVPGSRIIGILDRL